MEKKNNKIRPLRNVPDETWHQAKLNALKTGVTLGQYITQAIDHENERHIDLASQTTVQQFPLGKRIVRDGVPHVYVKAGEDINMNDAVQEERAEK